MTRISVRTNLMVAMSLVAVVAAGCQQPEHRMAQTNPETKMACQLCYDDVSTERQTHPRYGTSDVVVRKHMCPDCKNEVSIYREGGVLKVKCANCAPEGMPCDKCLPPDTPEGPRQRVRRSLRG